MARKSKRAKEVSVFDLFDDIVAEPMKMGDEMRGPLVADSLEGAEHSDSSTLSLEAAIFSESTTTTSGDDA